MAQNNPTLYASSFSSSRSPPSTFHPISLRLSLHRALTQDLSTYFHERNQIESNYIQSLQSLSSRLHGSSNKSQLVFQELNQINLDQRQQDLQMGQQLAEVRTQLEHELAELSRIHDLWKRKVVEQVEKPLRESLDKSEWQRWGQVERQLGDDVKEYESLVDKLSKAQAKATKSSKTSKLLSTQSSLSTLGSSLTSSLPSFLTQSQSLELSHLAFLKECLIKHGTLSSDLGRERMELGEKIVVKVLGIDEGAESEEWALREGQKAGGARGEGITGEFGAVNNNAGGVGVGVVGASSGGRTREESIAETVESERERERAPPTPSIRTDNLQAASNPNTNNSSYTRDRTTSRLSTMPPVAPLPLPVSPTDNDARSITSSRNDNFNEGGKKKKGGFGSKLSSFLGGKKDKGEKLDRMGERERSSSFLGTGDRANSSRYSTFTPQAQPDSSANSFRTEQRAEPEAPPVGAGAGRRSNDLLDDEDGPSSFRAPIQPITPSQGKTGGGGLFRRNSRMNSFNSQEGGSPASPQVTNGNRFVSEPTGVDEEGFSVPPRGYDRPIGLEDTTNSKRAGGEGGRNLLDQDDEDDEEPLRSDSVPKLSILPSTSSNLPPASPILNQESEQERLAALEAIKNSLGPPSSASSTGLNRRTTARGRRSEIPMGGGGNRSSMLPAAAGLSAAAGAAAIGGVSALERRETDDDIPLATIQQQQNQRRAAPPPPTSTSTATPSSINNPSRAMSILSTNSSITPTSNSTSAVTRRDPFAGNLEPGLKVSIVEQVNVLMKSGGQIQKVLVTGEISVHYLGGSKQGQEEEEEEEEEVKLKVTNLEEIEKTAPNSTYLSSSSSTTTSGDYTLYKNKLPRGQTVPILKYQLRPSSSSASQVPLLVKPVWRTEPSLTRIIVVYSLNPSFSSHSPPSPFGDEDTSSSSSSSPLEFSNLSLEIPFPAQQITSFQSKPSSIGRLLPTGALHFDLPPPSSNQEENKLLVSCQTGSQAKESNLGLKWRVEGKSIGKVGIEFEGLGEVRREIESGKYIVAQ